MLRFCSALILSLAAVPAIAQSVPLVSVEVTGGRGSHTLQTRHIYYLDENAHIWRLGTTVRLGPPGRIRPIASFERTTGCGMGWGCGHNLVCYTAPDGSCKEIFGEPEGFAFGAGIAGAFSRFVTAGLTAGAGFYRQRAVIAAGNVSLRVVPHLAIVLDARTIFSTNSRGDRTWFFPLSLGLRGY